MASAVCQKNVIRFVSPHVPTCLPQHLLRDMVKEFQTVAPDDRKNEFRAYSKKGGADYDHDHRTKKGLFQTVHETLDDLPNKLWTHPEVMPENEFLQALNEAKVPKSTQTFVETMNEKYLKPFLLKPFNTVWLSGNNIESAINNATRNHNFKFMGVFRPVEADTAYLVNQIKAVWNKKRRNSPYYKSYGVVWNTSANGNGNHWVAALFSPYKKTAEFFDSFGHDATGAVLQQLTKVKTEIAKLGKFSMNSWVDMFIGTQHQTQGQQCGVYTIWFFLQRIVKKKSYAAVQSHVVNDAAMIKVRKEHFIVADPKIIKLHEEFERKNEHKRQQIQRVPKEQAIPLLSDSEDEENERKQVREKKYKEGVEKYKARMSRKRYEAELERHRIEYEKEKQRILEEHKDQMRKLKLQEELERKKREDSVSRRKYEASLKQAEEEEKERQRREKSKPIVSRSFPISKQEEKKLDLNNLAVVKNVWADVVNICIRRFDNAQMKIRMATSLLWLRQVFLEQFCEANYEMPMYSFSHFIRCVMSLMHAYIQEHKSPEDKDKLLATAAALLAFKALGLDDSKGCYRLNLNTIVKYLPEYPGSKHPLFVTIKRSELKDMEIEMYRLSKNSPCLEEFERAHQRLGITKAYQYNRVAVPLPKPKPKPRK
jgi:hypothetical protein